MTSIGWKQSDVKRYTIWAVSTESQSGCCKNRQSRLQDKGHDQRSSGNTLPSLKISPAIVFPMPTSTWSAFAKYTLFHFGPFSFVGLQTKCEIQVESGQWRKARTCWARGSVSVEQPYSRHLLSVFRGGGRRKLFSLVKNRCIYHICVMIYSF